MLKQHKQTHYANDFIRGWYLNNDQLCDDLIEHFNSSEDYRSGTVGDNEIVKELKDSTDVTLEDSQVAFDYFSNLQKAVDEYIRIYPYANAWSPWRVLEGTNIQRYTPNQGYHAWHTERATDVEPNVSRHLVFMTYVNDVDVGGETEWFHQDLKVKPEKGLTIIWPSDWTFTHRGIPAPHETKYIITGWFSYTTNTEGENNGN